MQTACHACSCNPIEFLTTQTEISLILNDRVGAQNHQARHGHTDRARHLEIDYEEETIQSLYGQLRGVSASKNSVDKGRGSTKSVHRVRSIADDSGGLSGKETVAKK